MFGTARMMLSTTGIAAVWADRESGLRSMTISVFPISPRASRGRRLRVEPNTTSAAPDPVGVDLRALVAQIWNPPVGSESFDLVGSVFTEMGRDGLHSLGCSVEQVYFDISVDGVGEVDDLRSHQRGDVPVDR